MEENKVLQIDIKKVIESKNPKLVKLLTSFVLSYIKHILHQDEINAFLLRAKDRHDYDFVKAVLELFNITYQTHGIENVPVGGRYLFAANHTQGAIDSMCFVDSVHQYMGECRIVVNDVLLNLENFEPLFIPVNHFGSQNKTAAQLFDDAFQSNMQILYYPAGLVSRKKKGVIRDLEWKKSFINFAIKYQRDVVPVFIDAKNSNFFYRLANFRTSIGIKANIEMFFLPNEMYKQKGNVFNLYFGKPVSYTHFTKEKTPAEWAEYIKERVYELNKS